MIYRHIGLFIILLFIVLLFGCNSANDIDKIGIEKIVDAFYEADYDYERITETYNKDTDTYTSVIIDGQVFNKPYKEHYKVVSSETEPIAKEIFIENDKARILTNEGWMTQTVSRGRPAGYGKATEFKLDREETLDGKSVEIYTAEYTEKVSELYQIQEELEYTIKQEYYLNKEQQVLIRIVTDWTDRNEKIAIANDMSANGATLEQAQNNVALLPTLQQKETLNIFNMGNATEFEWPEFDNTTEN